MFLFFHSFNNGRLVGARKAVFYCVQNVVGKHYTTKLGRFYIDDYILESLLNLLLKNVFELLSFAFEN